MGDTKTFTSSTAAAVVAASLAMVLSTSALGACKTTLRGELVRSPEDQARHEYQASPRKFLFFFLDEIIQYNGGSSEKRFQDFVVPNTRTTFPIPFALDIDSPKDCPSELKLTVSSDDDRNYPHVLNFGNLAPQVTGGRMIRLGNFATIPVRGPTF
jgi:hypothetical protein